MSGEAYSPPLVNAKGCSRAEARMRSERLHRPNRFSCGREVSKVRRTSPQWVGPDVPSLNDGFMKPRRVGYPGSSFRPLRRKLGVGKRSLPLTIVYNPDILFVQEGVNSRRTLTNSLLRPARPARVLDLKSCQYSNLVGFSLTSTRR